MIDQVSAHGTLEISLHGSIDVKVLLIEVQVDNGEIRRSPHRQSWLLSEI